MVYFFHHYISFSLFSLCISAKQDSCNKKQNQNTRPHKQNLPGNTSIFAYLSSDKSFLSIEGEELKKKCIVINGIN